MHPILQLLPILGNALSLMTAFTGNETARKANAAYQQAAGLVKAASPLLTQFANGKEVTVDDVRNALKGMNESLNAFEAAIAANG